MYRRKTIMIVGSTLMAASLYWGVPWSNAQEQDSIQLQDPGQAVNCDGTARSGSTQGMRHSTSNCDREAAAQRIAERRAAAISGRPSPDQQVQPADQTNQDAGPADTDSTDTSGTDDTGGTNE